jgi:hypothetical protein
LRAEHRLQLPVFFNLLLHVLFLFRKKKINKIKHS